MTSVEVPAFNMVIGASYNRRKLLIVTRSSYHSSKTLQTTLNKKKTAFIFLLILKVILASHNFFANVFFRGVKFSRLDIFANLRKTAKYAKISRARKKSRVTVIEQALLIIIVLKKTKCSW